MNLEELRTAVADPSSARAQAFDVLANIAALVALADAEESIEMVQAREIAIRLVEHRDALGAATVPLDAMLRRLGLFPYVDPLQLGVADQLALEAHRPLDLPDDVVFHRVQAEVYRRLLDGENVILSAPTSFGKSLVIDALVASRRYRNIVIVVPTIALIDETRRRLMRFSPEFKLITHVSQPLGERNLLVLTQERVMDLAELPAVDLFVIDEFYKLSAEREPVDHRDRSYLLNQAFARMLGTGAQFYFLGPNIRELAPDLPADFAGSIVFIKTNVSTVALDEHHVGHGDSKAEREAALVKLCRSLSEPTLVYCQSPRSARDVVAALIAGQVSTPDDTIDPAVEWVAQHYHPEWAVTQGLTRGIGVHHGQMPRALAQFMVRAFKEGRLHLLVCTSSLIEGVNTPAKNVVVFDKRIGRANFDFFDFGNIRGRSGRMSVHHVGRVYLFHPAPNEALPEIDIPALTQSKDTPSSMLLGLPDYMLTDASRERMEQVIETSPLPEATLRENVGIAPERQAATFEAIESDLGRFAPLLAWRGPQPTYDELKVACELIWTHLNDGRREHGAYSSGQLTMRIHMLRNAPSVRELVEAQLTSDYAVQQQLTPTDVVDDTLDFLRTWATFNFPRLLIALDRIARIVLTRHGRPTGDFSVFAARVENLFLPAPLLALEEYGLPREAGQRLAGTVVGPEGDLDDSLRRLAALDPQAYHLHPFERELLRDVQASLAPQDPSDPPR